MNVMAPTVEQVCFRSAKAAQAIYMPPDRTLCRVLGMFKMFFPAADESMTPHVAMDGCWEAHVTSSAWRIIEPGMTVLNAGAHVGYYALMAAKIVGPRGRVDAFEPNPLLHPLLRSNVRLNGCDGVVHAEPRRALWGCSASKTVGWMWDRVSEGTLFFSNCGLSQATEACSVDDLAASEGLPRPDVMILDAEGSEPLIIRGAAKKIRQNPIGPWIICDWNPVAYDTCRNGADVLLDLNYLISRINDDGSWSALQPDDFRNLSEPAMLVCKRHPGGAE